MCNALSACIVKNTPDLREIGLITIFELPRIAAEDEVVELVDGKPRAAKVGDG